MLNTNQVDASFAPLAVYVSLSSDDNDSDDKDSDNSDTEIKRNRKNVDLIRNKMKKGDQSGTQFSTFKISLCIYSDSSDDETDSTERSGITNRVPAAGQSSEYENKNPVRNIKFDGAHNAPNETYNNPNERFRNHNERFNNPNERFRNPNEKYTPTEEYNDSERYNPLERRNPIGRYNPNESDKYNPSARYNPTEKYNKSNLTPKVYRVENTDLKTSKPVERKVFKPEVISVKTLEGSKVYKPEVVKQESPQTARRRSMRIDIKSLNEIKNEILNAKPIVKNKNNVRYLTPKNNLGVINYDSVVTDPNIRRTPMPQFPQTVNVTAFNNPLTQMTGNQNIPFTSNQQNLITVPNFMIPPNLVTANNQYIPYGNRGPGFVNPASIISPINRMAYVEPTVVNNPVSIAEPINRMYYVEPTGKSQVMNTVPATGNNQVDMAPGNIKQTIDESQTQYGNPLNIIATPVIQEKGFNLEDDNEALARDDEQYIDKRSKKKKKSKLDQKKPKVGRYRIPKYNPINKNLERTDFMECNKIYLVNYLTETSGDLFKKTDNKGNNLYYYRINKNNKDNGPQCLTLQEIVQMDPNSLFGTELELKNNKNIDETGAKEIQSKINEKSDHKQNKKSVTFSDSVKQHYRIEEMKQKRISRYKVSSIPDTLPGKDEHKKDKIKIYGNKGDMCAKVHEVNNKSEHSHKQNAKKTPVLPKKILYAGDVAVKVNKLNSPESNILSNARVKVKKRSSLSKLWNCIMKCTI